MPSKTVWEKGENAGAFSPFPTMFFTLSKILLGILATFKLSSANALNLDAFVVWLRVHRAPPCSYPA